MSMSRPFKEFFSELIFPLLPVYKMTSVPTSAARMLDHFLGPWTGLSEAGSGLSEAGSGLSEAGSGLSEAGTGP